MREEERLIEQAAKIGWGNYFDCGYGPQPVARYIGDKLGPYRRVRPFEETRRPNA